MLDVKIPTGYQYSMMAVELYWNTEYYVVSSFSEPYNGVELCINRLAATVSRLCRASRILAESETNRSHQKSIVVNVCDIARVIPNHHDHNVDETNNARDKDEQKAETQP